uniref:non-specific serine/threonine protein kinase n=1 Tax=Timspurckia oligopyrenoides TaxID=708627 RepID=A0A7S0ZJV7_9RHOD|mmetsp:Transcript_802/g.1487  ORF Transcript_802/g.1487 Transcript_802/m.1487 type:complete len:517 (+) Transcript_802:46-1596(+)
MNNASRYERLELVGSGMFGDVYRGYDQKLKKSIAIKVLDLEQQQEEIEIIQREIGVMSQLIHPNVVNYYTSFMNGAQLWIVMEFMNSGSVRDLLDLIEKKSSNSSKQIKTKLPEDALCELLRSVLRGLHYIHTQRKLHRDIKAANLMLNSNAELKLADFGVAGQLSNTMRARNTQVGSPYWMAPEVIQQNNYDTSADIWSFGITAIEMITGRPSLAHLHPMKALLMIPRMEPPKIDSVAVGVSKLLADLIHSCLRLNPRERPSAKALLDHPFFESHTDENVTRNALLQIIQSVRPLNAQSVSKSSTNSSPSNASNSQTTKHVASVSNSADKTIQGEFRDDGDSESTQNSATFAWDFDESDTEEEQKVEERTENVVDSIQKAVKGDEIKGLPSGITADGKEQQTVVVKSNEAGPALSGNSASAKRRVNTMASVSKPGLQRIVLPALARMKLRIADNPAQLTAMAKLGTAMMDGESNGDGFVDTFVQELLAQLQREGHPALLRIIERSTPASSNQEKK